jgi:ABC transporter substrate binding protein (PQQ-dependent alcohol dehydrogenase system)
MLRASTLAFAAGLASALAALPSVAQDEVPVFNVGYVQVEDDARYAREFVYARIPAVPRYRPLAGAEVAIAEAKQTGQFMGQDFELIVYSGESIEDVSGWVLSQVEEGTHFFVMDLGTEDIKALSAATAGMDVLLFNATDPDDSLRSEFCAAHLVHTAPSYNMLMDAIAQYLVFQNWTRLLILQGPLPDDAKMVEALRRSVRRNGARIIDVRPFVLSNDPREREQNNIRLMTGGTRDYDVVFVADTDGEFGRYVPYQTVRARPVVGTPGLTVEWWHWSFERHGAPQLNSRFFNYANRFMQGPDWAAWAAVRSIAQAATRTRTTEFAGVRDYLLSDQLRFDAYKGQQADYRPWNHQLRQNLLVSVHNAVIARAPLEKFEHAVNDLDTLGVDAPETTCNL